jgi:hypothetical protein
MHSQWTMHPRWTDLWHPHTLSPTMTWCLQRRPSLWPCGLTNPLDHAATPPPCAPPPACLRMHRRSLFHARRRLHLFPPPLSIYLPLSTLESRVWCRFSRLGRPSDAYPTKSTPWHTRRMPYRIQLRHYRRPGSPSAVTTWCHLSDALKT